MNDQVKRALFSVDNPESILEFARALNEMGWHIIATSETVKKLKKHGISVEDAAAFTALKRKNVYPPTLHPKIEEALTLDVAFRIDLVYDIPYPLTKGNDVGGRTLLALGAKGKRIVVLRPEDMRRVLKELRRDPAHSRISDSYRLQLIDKVNAHISEHYLTLARRGGESVYDGTIGTSILRLMNGENPYQVPSDLFARENQDALSLHRLHSENAAIPCFTNLADTDAIMHTLCLAAEAYRLHYKDLPLIAVCAKHGNPCGMSASWKSAEAAVTEALFGNPIAIWGGECITNFTITEKVAVALTESTKRRKMLGDPHWMLDVVAAPDFDKKAVEILTKRPSRKIFKNPALGDPVLPGPTWHYRHVRGGFLRQPFPRYILDMHENEGDISRFTHDDIDSLILAWSVAYSSNHGGNEVVLAEGSRLLGVGGGPSTVDAVKTAVMRSRANGHDTRGSVFAADAFFPFTDAPKVLKGAGCRGGLVPSGGKNDELVKKYFQKNGINVLYIPPQYRGFCRH